MNYKWVIPYTDVVFFITIAFVCSILSFFWVIASVYLLLTSRELL